MSEIITLTTDFGLDDWFVGTMKGVILGINPAARIVDLTHGVPAGGVAAGAFALAAGCRYFPRGTVHVAVVDPGVGSGRAALAVRTADYTFVGPDNGVLSLALRREQVRAIHRLERAACFLPSVSRTFHGRDVFAPVAAALSKGAPLRRLGPAVTDYATLDWTEPEVVAHGVRGRVVYLDRFGNALTNIPDGLIPRAATGHAVVRVHGRRWCRLETHYAAVSVGQPVAVIGSAGLLELAVNGGSAARRLRLRVGQTVTLTMPERTHGAVRRPGKTGRQAGPAPSG